MSFDTKKSREMQSYGENAKPSAPQQAALEYPQIAHFAALFPYIYNRSTKEECQMRKRKLKIFLTPTENSIVIQSLNHLRNALLRENRDTGCLDELLLKVMCAPVKKM